MNQNSLRSLRGLGLSKQQKIEVKARSKKKDYFKKEKKEEEEKFKKFKMEKYEEEKHDIEKHFGKRAKFRKFIMDNLGKEKGFDLKKFQKEEKFDIKKIEEKHKHISPATQRIIGKKMNLNRYRGNFRMNQGYTNKSNIIESDQSSRNRSIRPNINTHYYGNDGSVMRGGGYNPGLAKVALVAAGYALSKFSKADLIIDALNKIKETGKVAYNLYGSQPATYAKNALIAFDKNPRAKTGFAGEKHIIMPTEYGWSMANYCGPGTNVNARLERGDQGIDGINGIDEQCMKHDIRYRDAQNVEDIRSADKAFIKNVESSKGSTMAKRMIKGVMKTKIFAENMGVLDPLEVTDFPNIEGGRIGMYKNNIHVSKEYMGPRRGKGLKSSIKKLIKHPAFHTPLHAYPGHNLKQKLLRKYNKTINPKLKRKLRRTAYSLLA